MRKVPVEVNSGFRGNRSGVYRLARPDRPSSCRGGSWKGRRRSAAPTGCGQSVAGGRCAAWRRGSTAPRCRLPSELLLSRIRDDRGRCSSASSFPRPRLEPIRAACAPSPRHAAGSTEEDACSVVRNPDLPPFPNPTAWIGLVQADSPPLQTRRVQSAPGASSNLVNHSGRCAAGRPRRDPRRRDGNSRDHHTGARSERILLGRS
jgi:hypothetical protein